MTMRFAIIGCGEAGSRRATAIDSVPGATVSVFVDPVHERAQLLASRFGGEVTSDWREAVTRPDVDAVIIATANNLHSSIAAGAAQAGKHILCERPIARNPTEAEQIIGEAREHGVKLKIGLHLRYHPITRQARQFIDEGRLGRLLFIRGVTGRGSYQTPPAEWLLDCDIAGGGTLLDNGYDLIDLCRFFMGDFREAVGHSSALLYNIRPCEDNAFAVLKTADGRAAIIHSSWTEWRYSLKLDISGTDGYLLLDYDNSTITYGSRPGAPGANVEQILDLSAEPDNSVATEISDLMDAVHNNREPEAGGIDGLETLILARAVYRSSEDSHVVRV